QLGIAPKLRHQYLTGAGAVSSNGNQGSSELIARQRRILLFELAQGTRPRQCTYAEQTVQTEGCRSLRQSELLSIGARNEPRPNHDVAQLQTQQSLLDVIARLEIRVAR